jgi:hypothetical protein
MKGMLEHFFNIAAGNDGDGKPFYMLGFGSNMQRVIDTLVAGVRLDKHKKWTARNHPTMTLSLASKAEHGASDVHVSGQFRLDLTVTRKKTVHRSKRRRGGTGAQVETITVRVGLWPHPELLSKCFLPEMARLFRMLFDDTMAAAVLGGVHTTTLDFDDLFGQ